MKKYTYLITVVTILFSFLFITSCGDEEQPKQPQTPEATQPQTKPDTTTQPETLEPVVDVNKPKKNPEKVEEWDIPSIYEVHEGETLASIAYKFYQDSTKWMEIFAMNESDIDNWNYIYPGQEFKMPQINDVPGE